MAFPPLNRHSGRLSWERQIGRLYVSVKLAEDPQRRPLRRKWAQQSPSGDKETEYWVALVRVRKVFADGDIASCMNLYFGPLAIWWGWRDM